MPRYRPACAHVFGDTDRYDVIKLHMDNNDEMTRQDGERVSATEVVSPF